MVAENKITVLEREIDGLFATARQALRDAQNRIHDLVNDLDVVVADGATGPKDLAAQHDEVLARLRAKMAADIHVRYGINYANALEKAREKQRAKQRSDCDDCLAVHEEVALIQSSHVHMRPYCDCCEKVVEASHVCGCEGEEA